MTAQQLRQRGIHGRRLADQVRRRKVFRLLGDLYCDRQPTTADKCSAVALWREDAVLSHYTALWLHGLGPEPDVIDAYVSSAPDHAVPGWLRLHVAPRESYVRDAVRL